MFLVLFVANVRWAPPLQDGCGWPWPRGASYAAPVALPYILALCVLVQHLVKAMTTPTTTTMTTTPTTTQNNNNHNTNHNNNYRHHHSATNKHNNPTLSAGAPRRPQGRRLGGLSGKTERSENLASMGVFCSCRKSMGNSSVCSAFCKVFF